MIELLQRTLDGLLDGASYALVGLGLALTFGILRRLNLAYGAGAMLAAYAGAWLHIQHGAPLWVIALTVIATAALAGLYVEWLCFSRTHVEAQDAVRGGASVAGRDAREVVALASSFALWMQLEQLATHLLPRHMNPFPSLAVTAEWTLGPVVLRPDRLALGLATVALILGLSYWLRVSRTGLSWRAAADQRTAAQLSGIAVARAQRVAFVLACALSGVAAFAVLSLEGQLTPMFGMWVMIKGLVAALLGGLGSLTGVLLGGLALGVVEAHAQALFGAIGREAATYALLFLVLTLPWRRDLFGTHHGH
ncbi:MAG: branched-chain amino acid ABC transporter permease [Betaproteobacteria bacterium]|nr:branched-chain amino acid ABC transporter permease [Betaproteobacteria bacterium]